ncbi:CD1375 family protein [Psychrobacillus sp. FSL K6-1415]
MFMVAIFSGLIAGKRRTIVDVPDHLKEPVLADLATLGLDGQGNLITD